MNLRRILSVAIAAPLLSLPVAAADTKVTFNDQILPIFKNACLNCHNPDKKKAGLDLSTYQGTLAGSDNGKVLESGNPDKSLLLKTVKHTEEPKMPPKGDKLTDPEIAMVESWIKGQLLETSSSKAVAPSNNVQLTVISLDRPPGPPPMPSTDLPLEPLVRTKNNNALIALAASPWAPLVAIGGQQQIVLYNTESLQTLGILPFPEGFPAVVRFSRNGQLLLTGGGLGGKSGKVVLWKVATGERAGVVGNEFDSVLGADISPDHAFVALGGPTKLLKIYSTKDGKQVESIKKHTDWITAVAYSPDGKFLASADRNGGLEVWEGATGKPYNSLPGHKAMITALAFMPGVLASASEDGKIVLWDVKEGKEIRNWTAHAGGVSSVDFTPDGRLVSSGRDKLAKAWDQNGKAILTSQPFNDIALRAVLNSERVIAGDWSGQIRVFDLKDGKPVGELTSNPPQISEALAAAEKRVADLNAQIKSSQDAVAAAEAKLKAAQAAAEKKYAADIAAAEAAAKKTQADLDSLKAAPQKLETQLAAERKALAAMMEARGKLPEAERPAAQAKLDEAAKKSRETEVALAKSKLELNNKTPSLQKHANEAAQALAKLKSTPAKLQPTAESIAAHEAARKQAEAITPEVERLRKARDNQRAGTPQYTQADAQYQARAQALAQAVAKRDAAKLAASAHPLELELANTKAALQKAQSDLPVAIAGVQHWQRAQAYMSVHRASQAFADLKARHEGMVNAVKDALVPVDRATSDIAAAEKVAATAAAAAKEKQAAAAKLRTDAEAAKKASANAESALAAAEARAKPAAPGAAAAVTKEVATAKETLAKQQAASKDLEAKLAEAVKVADAAKKLSESESAKVPELKKKAAEIATTAKTEKVKNEKEVAELAKQLDAAKAQADRVRKDYEARFRAQTAAPKPLAAQ